MTFLSVWAAKQFFIDKILQQAKKDNVALSPAEKYMLAFSESDPDFKNNEELSRQFEKTINSDVYEQKIADLLNKAYQFDMKINRLQGDLYQEAYNMLKNFDNYILVMAEVALGKAAKLKKFDIETLTRGVGNPVKNEKFVAVCVCLGFSIIFIGGCIANFYADLFHVLLKTGIGLIILGLVVGMIKLPAKGK
jgi:hypothetical protein